MRKAAESAAKWLADKVMGNPKLNPIPYPFFKSIVNKQVEWAAKRGMRLDFLELSEAVRAELLKAGIYTMSENGRQEHRTESIFDTDTEIPPLALSLSDDAPKMPALFKWLYSVFDRAASEGFKELHFSVKAVKEDGHA
ncbi:MAG: hypothetical protein IJG37_08330 [Synergistaceae bacterium]|nr:hypothetical protein [Synergistaceae bacterium]